MDMEADSKRAADAAEIPRSNYAIGPDRTSSDAPILDDCCFAAASCLADEHPPVRFLVSAQFGVWRMTMDGHFFGDFPSWLRAREAVNSAVREIAENGGRAEVSWK